MTDTNKTRSGIIFLFLLFFFSFLFYNRQPTDCLYNFILHFERRMVMNFFRFHTETTIETYKQGNKNKNNSKRSHRSNWMMISYAGDDY